MERAADRAGIEHVRLAARPVGVEEGPRVDRGLALGDAREAVLDHVDRTDLAGVHPPGELGRRGTREAGRFSSGEVPLEPQR